MENHPRTAIQLGQIKACVLYVAWLKSTSSPMVDTHTPAFPSEQLSELSSLTAH